MTLSASGLPKVEGLEKVFLEDNPASAQTPSDKDQNESAAQAASVQQKQVEAPLQDGQAKQMTDDEILAQFKSTKDLLKSYKEIQGYTTRVSQENKALKDKTAQLEENLNKFKEELEIRKFQPPPQQQRPQKTFEELFVENPEQALELKAMQVANTQRIAEILEEEEGKNPSEFPERLNYVKMLAQQPRLNQLSFSPKGVKKLFDIADAARKEQLVKRAHESLKVIFGEDVDIEKFKELVRKDQQTTQTQTTVANPLDAYMPTTRTTTRTGADVDMNKNELEQAKQEAIKLGDASKVAGVLIKQALLK